MNLRNIDLNLLVVLDALLDEAHVSRAAHRLNLSQPAVSSALQRCRDLFEDPLLKRGRGVMHRTPRAEALRAPLKSLLTEVHDLVDPPTIPLNKIEQIVRITSADDPIAMIANPLVKKLQQTAPGITIVFQPWHGADNAANAVLKGDTHIAISVFDHDIEGLQRDTLIVESYTIAMRRGHPAAAKFDLSTWLAWPHIVVSGRGDVHAPLDAQLSTLNLNRRVGVVMPSFQLVPSLLVETDYIAMVPRHSIGLRNNQDLMLFEPPITVAGFILRAAWHERQLNDIGVRHVMSELKSIFSALD